ncbi:hypothetical protein L581_2888 [Serratia fonticola AU-AP2C]|nr:hypothetical protein L581_2888 [Serratia fonticola AU-AP2C]
MKLNTEQKRTQISSSHRLIGLTKSIRHKLDTDSGYGKNFELIEPDYFLNGILPKLLSKLNTTISKRQTALLRRIRNKASVYGVTRLTANEYATETLFDSYFFKNNEKYVNRIDTANLVRSSIKNYNKIMLVIPLLSRKPISPIKNKGFYPDLGEINTLLRCAKLVKTLINVSGYNCELIILADGNKYNRACQTPLDITTAYQSALQYWIDALGIGDCVKLVDYESWVCEGNDSNWIERRESIYADMYKTISITYDSMFFHNDLSGSMNAMKGHEMGDQLAYTFWSIITSVNYRSLFSCLDYKDIFSNREVQNFYISFIASLEYSIGKVKKSHLFSRQLVGDQAFRSAEIVKQMRVEAWEAAKKYVAISLTDRKLNTIYQKTPTAIKLTIHGKKCEFNFITTTAKDFSKTAQHTVGGLGDVNGNMVIDYKYRIERESDNEVKTYIARTVENGNEFNPLREMSLINQPIYYTSK